MTVMRMGSNIELSGSPVRASLRWTAGPGVPDVDASALLLQQSGMVGGDADFVFYNQPEHPSGSVRMAGKVSAPGTADPKVADQVDVDLPRVPAGVTRVVLAASAGGGTFGQVPGLELVLTDLGTGEHVAAFPMQAGSESAFVCAEIYRRNDTWKFRAVGQGYSSGLAGLAADFGIQTGDAPAPPAATAPPAPPAAPAPPAPAAPPVPSATSSLDLGGPPAPPAAPSLDLSPPAPPAPAAPAAAPPAPPAFPADTALDLDAPWPPR